VPRSAQDLPLALNNPKALRAGGLRLARRLLALSPRSRRINYSLSRDTRPSASSRYRAGQQHSEYFREGRRT